MQILNERKKSESSTITQLDADSAAARKSKIKKEPSLNSCGPNEATNDPTDLKDEPGDFIETNCHWKDCSTEFGTQEELVKVCKNRVNKVASHYTLFIEIGTNKTDAFLHKY